jgi:Protein of unknown function (DUF2800)/Helicase conserved C-terminal domain
MSGSTESLSDDWPEEWQKSWPRPTVSRPRPPRSETAPKPSLRPPNREPNSDPVTVQPYDWQEPAILAGLHAISTFGGFINASEMGTGKTLVTLFTAKRLGRPLAVVSPKSVVPDWEEWGARVGVPVQALSYGKVRTGKTPFGHWQMKTKEVKYFKWDLPPETLLVFDEVHECAGLETQQAELLCSAKRQKYSLLMLSGTLAESPLKMRAIGYAADLHRLVDFWPWAERNGLVYVPRKMFIRGRQVAIRTPEWPYLAPQKRSTGERIMEGVREALGDRFYRIRKDQVPGFPKKQVVPLLLPTKKLDISDFDSGEYGYEARMASELLKVPGLAERTRDQLSLGNSVALFVNYLDTLSALREEFPEASIVCGGQTSAERVTNLNRFQTNEAHVILVITQAGGTGVSLHDLHGRPRVSYLCPGDSASRFLQAIDRIHRAGSLSHATIYVVFAAGVRVERRARERMESKLNNLSALNDSDLLGFEPSDVTNLNPPHHVVNDPTHAAHSPGVLLQGSGAPEPERSEPPHQPAGCSGGQPHQPRPERSSVHPLHDAGDCGTGGEDCDLGGPVPEARLSGVSPQDSYAIPGHPGEGEDTGAEGVRFNPGSGGTAPMVRIATPPGWAVIDKAASMPPVSDASTLTAGTPIPAPPVMLAVPAPDATGNHGVRKHARCSPSKLKNLELCPSYEGDTDGPVHPVTLRGTAMHEALETSNDSGLLTEKDNEELRLVTVCREFQIAEAVPGEVVITEPHLKTHDRDVMGFADRVVLEPGYTFLNGHTGLDEVRRKARIRDYKMGWNPVEEPQDNPQAISYTVAVFMAYPNVTEVDFAFLIPRLDLVLQHTFQRSDLPGLKLRISTIAERVRKLAGKEFNVVDTNCLYCGRKATCQALHAKALPLARGYDDVLESKLPLPASFNPAELADPVQVAYGLNLAAIMEGWIEQMRKRATEFRKDNGVEIPGYDWIERSAPRVVSNPVGAYEIATKEFGVTPEAFLSATKISVTQLSAVVADAAPKGEKAKAEERLTDRLMDSMCLTRGAPFFVLQRARKKKLKDAPAA